MYVIDDQKKEVAQIEEQPPFSAAAIGAPYNITVYPFALCVPLVFASLRGITR